MTKKRVKVQRVVSGTKAEARKARDQLRQEHERGLDMDATKVECARLLACVDESEAQAYTDLAEKESRQIEWGKAFGRSSMRGLIEICSVIAVRIGLATGMRRGEVFGLCWGGVDLN